MSEWISTRITLGWQYAEAMPVGAAVRHGPRAAVAMGDDPAIDICDRAGDQPPWTSCTDAVIKPESVRQSKSVWCSKDRVKSWNDLMLRDVEPTASTNCDNPIDELVALGKKLGATGTPTWLLANGEKYQGASPMNTLLPLLVATAQRAK